MHATELKTSCASILVGQFDEAAVAEAVADELRHIGIPVNDVEVFMLNSPGQHDTNPQGIGGDEDADSKAKQGDTGAVTGAAIGGTAGLVVGALTMPVVGPLGAVAGAGIGAYAGSLAGAVNKMGDKSAAVAIPPRPAGMRVAVCIPSAQRRARVEELFLTYGANSIEDATGHWENGKWVDFDPRVPPRWLVAPTQR